MTARPPLPGSLDEYRMTAKLRRLVMRGGVARDPRETRVAADLARQELTRLAGRRRLMLGAAVVLFVLGVIQLALADTLIGALSSLVVGAAVGVGSFIVERLLRARLAQAVRMNEKAALAAEQPQPRAPNSR
jgi:hypothetical protein